MEYLQKLAGFQLGKHELKGPSKQRYRELKIKEKELDEIADVDMTDELFNELNDVCVELQDYSL